MVLANCQPIIIHFSPQSSYNKLQFAAQVTTRLQFTAQVTTRLQFTDHDANEYELRPFQHNGNHYQNELLQGSQLGIDPLSSVK